MPHLAATIKGESAFNGQTGPFSRSREKGRSAG